MKSYGKFLVFAATLFILSSCTDSKLKSFAKDFAEYVSAGDSANISKMYPNSSLAEKLSLNIQDDSLSVEEKTDTFVVNLGNGQSLSIVKVEDEDFEFRIVDSHKVFDYPEERLAFAHKTGWIDGELSDQKIAERFADTLFVKYLAQKNLAQFKNLFVVKKIDFEHAKDSFSPPGTPWYMYYPVIVANKTEFDISGEDYLLSIHQTDEDWTVNGVDIKSGEEKSITVKAYAAENEYPTAKIVLKLQDIDLLSKYFKPKGNEYADYLKNKR